MSLKILLVEDSPTQALRIRRALEAQGFEVAAASDGKEALEIARRERPDAILSDILMPGMDGFQLCLEVRQDPELSGTPVVLQTASFHSDDDRAFAYELGSDGYIDKNLPAESLASALAEAVAGREVFTAGRGVPPLDERSFRVRYGDRLARRLVEEAAELERANEALAAAYDATLEALVAALDLRDTDTEHHSWRVAEYAVTLAGALGIDGRVLSDLERGSLLHDVGKIGVPDHILRKPGPLDEDEWREMRRHPQLGYGMLAHIDFLRGAAEIVLSHHERWDGSGYPRGLSGEQIPLGARLFAVADALDAITSSRPYRAARGFDAAIAEITKMSGTQFDPEVVRAAAGIDPADWERTKEQVESRRRRRNFALSGHGLGAARAFH